ncbi:A-kinase-interacting protein 1 isoform X2 [Syngnathus scovelli]|uniref:A-kinase-interacting protein 1 isoform X2 n=1 Tax=Syngnathus scovelli TaxID=161590 RepID=UPI00210FC907|nr:A-kinase-interacting protein 1 isoform X2 [Syngnathus scovelli]
MATLAGLEYSLQKSARLGLELLDRASRRKVNWSKPPPTYASMAEIDKDLHKKTLAELQEAFASIIKFMAETHIQCKRFYDSVGCAQGSIIEREHVPRFHDHVRPTRNEYPPQYREHGQNQDPKDNLYVEVALESNQAGTQQQTKMVAHGDGDTFSITFNH